MQSQLVVPQAAVLNSHERHALRYTAYGTASGYPITTAGAPAGAFTFGSVFGTPDMLTGGHWTNAR
jgi:hypothetical protein